MPSRWNSTRPLPSDAQGRLAAVTGASGFVGSHCVAALAARGFRVRILTRRDPTHALWAPYDIEAVSGRLEDEDALTRLVAGADVVVHVAGLVKARRRREFHRANCEGTRRLANAMRRHSPAARLLLISSLAAREPHLSPYAASKRGGEEAAAEAFAADPGRLTIIRPAAIYGPGDLETLLIFKAAFWPFVPLAGRAGGRVALIHVADVAEAVAALALGTADSPVVYELADQTPAGYGLVEIAMRAARAVGRQPRYFRVPDGILKRAGAVADLLGFVLDRPRAFSRGKVRELLHPDWSVRPDALPPAAVWRPAIPLDQGFADTVLWYRRRRWLRN